MKCKYLSVLIIIVFCFNAFAGDNLIIVAKDGSGDFITIQEAINSVQSTNRERTIIFIKNGVYSEKIFIEKNNLAIIGESADSTMIIYAELRKNWRQNNPNDYGSAVINIKNGITDILFSSLTIHNNYGDLYGDNDHAFAIRGGEGVTRIIIDSCKVISGGGDTVSLWNKDDGMYYHSNSFFEGWVDFVCPRGYCYIENSIFYGHNLTAALWHDGSMNENHKFVLKNCRFDGEKGFPLGRFHWDAQFYFIDCTFSENMADKKIFFAPSTPTRILNWGESRQYFFNCHGETVDYDWHLDNIEEAHGKPDLNTISAAWTFNYKWDPVKELIEFYRSFEIVE